MIKGIIVYFSINHKGFSTFFLLLRWIHINIIQAKYERYGNIIKVINFKIEEKYGQNKGCITEFILEEISLLNKENTVIKVQSDILYKSSDS